MPLRLNTVIAPAVRRFNRQVAAGVNRASFGDGYSQRSKKGPNSVAEKVRVRWQLPAADIDQIEAFLRDHAGVTAFEFQLPGSERVQLWTCEKWSVAPLSDADDGSMSLDADFVEEFDIF